MEPGIGGLEAEEVAVGPGGLQRPVLRRGLMPQLRVIAASGQRAVMRSTAEAGGSA